MDSTATIFDPNRFSEKATNSRLTQVWTALPGIIQKFDAGALTCEVQPAIKGRVTQEDGSIQLVNMPLLLDCPVVFPHGGGCSLTFPIKAGDECLVVFASRGIDYWWQLGGIQPPPEARMHDLSDGFVIPGPWSQAQKISGVSTSAVQLRSDDGAAFIELNPGSHNVKCETSGDFSVKCKNCTVEASAGASIKAPAIQLEGPLTNTAGSAAKMAGGVETDADVTAAGISLKSHVHSGVSSGSNNTGGPK